MPVRNCMPSRLLSTSRITVKTPKMNTAGRTMATNGPKSWGDWDAKPIATRELDSEKMYRDARAPTSLLLALTAVCSTKCSVVNADINAGWGCFSSMGTLQDEM